MEATMPRKKSRVDLFEKHARILERVAVKYSRRSAESKSIALAAEALCFALFRFPNEFTGFMKKMRKPIAPKDERYLKKLGLVPEPPKR